MPTVYIINNSAHDFSPAKQYGTLSYLSDQPMNKFATNNIFRQFLPKLRNSNPEDYILITSFNTANIIATTIMGALHGKLNLLIWNDQHRKYVERVLSLHQLKGMMENWNV